MKMVRNILSKMLTKDAVQFGAIAAVLFFLIAVWVNPITVSLLGSILTFGLGIFVYWAYSEKDYD